MTRLESPDLCVIGAGSGGLSVAAAAAAFGVPVTLIERGEMGGDCLNAGCVPSKALIAAAKAAHTIRTADRFGIAAREPEIDMAAVRDHVRGVIATIAPHDSEERFTRLGVTVVRAPARFLDPETVEAGGRRFRARRFVIATGSRASIPPIPGLRDGPYLTNETVFDLDRRPGHLLVLGGGPIGCELAQAFRRLGAAVTLVEAKALLGRDDPEAAALVGDALRREGVRLETGGSVVAVRHGAGNVTLVLERPEGRVEVTGTDLLVAVGRTPVMDGLDLDRAGVVTGPAGVTVDAGLRSVSNRRVYAVGDVAGFGQFTHLAGHHAGLVVRSALFRLPVRAEAAAIPSVTYTDPEIGRAGLSEADARARHGAVQVWRAPFDGNDRAVTERATEGFVKIVAGRRGRILGGTVAGHGAGDLVGALQVAVTRGLTLRAFTDAVLPYPTRVEALKRAAVSAYAPFAATPWVRGAVALLRRLG